MTAILGRQAFLALAKETTPGTFVPGSVFWPVTASGLDAEDVYAELRDESLRNDDTVLHGLYQGPGQSTHKYESPAYPDLVPHWLRAVIGPDTVTPGVATTLSSSSIVGATSISTAASIPVGSTIMIDVGSKVEYAVTGTPTGAGPFAIPIASPAGGLTQAHNSAVAVVSQSTHSFKQNPAVARVVYSVSKFNGVNTKGFASCAFSELGIKIDPKGIVMFHVAAVGFPATVVSNPVWAGPTSIPMLGWQWTLTQNGVASTRGLTLDLTWKRTVEAIPGSDGTINPREVFQGAIELDGTLKAIFENTTDLALFENYTQSPTVATITQPLTAGGSVITITASKSGYPKAKIDNSGAYATIDLDARGIWNSTDGGVSSVTITNYISTAY